MILVTNSGRHGAGGRPSIASRFPHDRVWRYAAQFLIVAFLSIASASAATAQQRNGVIPLSGEMHVNTKRPLGAVQLTVKAAGAEVFERVIELGKDGAFTVQLSAPGSRTVDCYFSAPGFAPVRIMGVVTGSGIRLGTVRLKAIVELSPPRSVPGQGDVSIIDFWITSHTAKPLTFLGVSITSRQRLGGRCFDSVPIEVLRFNLAGHIRSRGSGESIAGVLKITTKDGDARYDEPILRIEAKISKDVCGALTVDLLAPYSFSLTTADRGTPRKVRLEVPNTIASQRFGPIRPDWGRALIELDLGGGEKIGVSGN